MMDAYLIDPLARSITLIDVADADDEGKTQLASLYAHMQCADVEAVAPVNAEGDVIYLDEYGKYHPKGFFFCRLWPNDTLTGRAVWIGCDGDGGHTAPAMPLDYVQAHIVWR